MPNLHSTRGAPCDRVDVLLRLGSATPLVAAVDEVDSTKTGEFASRESLYVAGGEDVAKSGTGSGESNRCKIDDGVQSAKAGNADADLQNLLFELD
jgi:hypothetical protein